MAASISVVEQLDADELAQSVRAAFQLDGLTDKGMHLASEVLAEVVRVFRPRDIASLERVHSPFPSKTIFKAI